MTTHYEITYPLSSVSTVVDGFGQTYGEVISPNGRAPWYGHATLPSGTVLALTGKRRADVAMDLLLAQGVHFTNPVAARSHLALCGHTKRLG